MRQNSGSQETIPRIPLRYNGTWYGLTRRAFTSKLHARHGMEAKQSAHLLLLWVRAGLCELLHVQLLAS